jgi:G3E family GTPase
MGNADPEGILDTGLHRGGGKVADAGSWLLTGAYRPIGTPLPAGHDPAVRSFAWFAQRPLRWRELEDTLGTLLEVAGERILRLKGLANLEGEEGPVAIHAIQHTLYPAARLGRWPDADRRTRLVFVVRDLEESHVAQMLQSLAAAPGAARAFESARS